MTGPARTDLEERVARLETEVQRLRDEREITAVLTSYGPLVDSGRAEHVAGLWEPDGVYDVDEGHMAGREQIQQMVRGEKHQGFLRGGCAHFLSPHRIRVSGDEATAVGHSLLVVATDEGFRVRRATANRWTLRRGDHGWQVVHRTGRVLDGRADARELLATIAGAPANEHPQTADPTWQENP